jgi:hypothetical protein
LIFYSKLINWINNVKQVAPFSQESHKKSAEKDTFCNDCNNISTVFLFYPILSASRTSAAWSSGFTFG